MNGKQGVLALVSLLSVGCVTPQPYRQEAVVPEQELTVGVVQREIRAGMSQGDVASALGSPNIVSKDAGGKETWIYDKIGSEARYSDSAVGGSIIIFGGGTSWGSSSRRQKTLTVIVKFSDKNLVESTTYHASRF
jgi:outer membrane protein assembly factor BamE (lipoprotein component of BamABCDE complex)